MNEQNRFEGTSFENDMTAEAQANAAQQSDNMTEIKTEPAKPAKRKFAFLGGMLTGLAIAVVVVGILYLIGSINYSKQHPEGGLDVTTEEMDSKLEEIQQLINLYYLDEVDTEKVEDMICLGMLSGLEDPYSTYYTMDQFTNQMDSDNGSYSGIGAVFSQSASTGIITVIRVYDGCPAMEAGIHPGDILYMIEDEYVTGEELSFLVNKIKGYAGTFVHLTFVRGEETVEFDVERRPIEIPTVSSEMLDDEIGYIQITEFDGVTSAQFGEALDDLRSRGMKGLVLDLRDNGGGRVNAAAAIADLLLPEGLIVYTEMKDGSRRELSSDAERYLDMPLTVLVNGHTASASEILAGAIRDYGIGTLIGTTTYGKGIVQQQFQLSDGSAIRLTIAKYYTPSGSNIHGVGIEPDIVVDLDEELKGQAVISHEEDNQLGEALKILRAEIK